MNLVTQEAPNFTAPAVLATGEIITDFTLHKVIKNKYALLLFYPLDFTFVCPSELISLNNKNLRFKENNVEVIGISVDSQYTHNAWRNTPVEQGGIGKINFPLVADLKHQICKDYGVEHLEAGVALRASFIIDKNKIIRHATINDLPLGRNIEEFIRIIDALQHYEKYGEVCPANWKKGTEAMTATSEGVAAYLANNADKI